MTVYYVDPTAVGLANGLTKADAFITLAAAFAVATGEGDEIRCAHDKMDVLAADTTYTIAANKLSVLSWNFATDKQEVGFSVGHLTLNRSLTFNMAATPASNQRMLRIYGITFTVSGATADSINLFTAHSGLAVFWEVCSFVIQNTSTSCRINIGGGGEYHGIQFFLGCYFSRVKAAQTLVLGDHKAHFQNCEFHSTVENAATAIFSSLEQGPDTLLEYCYVNGYFRYLITGTVTGTRAVRMIGGNWAVPHGFPYLNSTAGMWGFEQELRDVCVTILDAQVVIKYSVLKAPGRTAEFYLSDNTGDPNDPSFTLFMLGQEVATPDVEPWARPIGKIKATQKADTLPTFWRIYFMGYYPDLDGTNPVSLTASVEYLVSFGGLKRRLVSFNLFDGEQYSPEIVEVIDPFPLLQTELNNHGYDIAYYIDLPRAWLTRGAGATPTFTTLHEWEIVINFHLRNQAYLIILPRVYADGLIDYDLQIAMEGGFPVQTKATEGGGPIPDPLPGYKSLVLYNGALAQVDVTLNEPPTGTPAVWDGTVLRTLLPGESVVLQNP
jgi:hypothetical protein